MVYLFVGQDTTSKDQRLKALREQFLSSRSAQFNYERLGAVDLSPKELQEKLLCLPVDNPVRLIVLARADAAKKEVKEFLFSYAAKPYPHVVLVIDAERIERKDTMLSGLMSRAQVVRFREDTQIDTFALGRSIESGKTAEALQALRVLLKAGEKPERIIGGLRYSWDRGFGSPETARRIKLLLTADAAIKTGRMKPDLALETLIVSLAGRLGKPFHQA
jgi:DNA polymerase III delta subunit